MKTKTNNNILAKELFFKENSHMLPEKDVEICFNLIKRLRRIKFRSQQWFNVSLLLRKHEIKIIELRRLT